MRNFLFLLLLFPILLSCEKELDFKYHDVESQLVIEGNLNDKGTLVSVSYTVPMIEPFNYTPVENAEVVLTDLTAQTSYTLIFEEGKYSSKTQGIPGHQYELTVTHEGKRYSSTCLMLKGIDILNLEFQWIKMPYDHVAILEITTTVSELEGTCYWTKIYKNGQPYKWLVSHGSGAIDGKLSQTTFTTRQNPDDEEDKDNLKDGDILTVKVSPISIEMYDYLTAISSDSNGPALFSGDFCLGYFLAAEEAESSITFHPADIPYYP